MPLAQLLEKCLYRLGKQRNGGGVSMRRVFVLVALLLLSGCAGQMVFGKPNTSKQQFYADQSFCNERAQITSSGTDGLMGLAMFMQAKQMCMAGKGYQCHYSESQQPCEITN